MNTIEPLGGKTVNGHSKIASDSSSWYVSWREQAWLLKKSIFLKTAEIWGIENVYPNREGRL
jgi:hypothetical protein